MVSVINNIGANGNVMDNAKIRQKRYAEKRKSEGYSKQSFYVKEEFCGSFKEIANCLNSINEKNHLLAIQAIQVIIKNLYRMK